MRLAPTHNTAEPVTITGGLLLRMRMWFAAGAAACSAPCERQVAALDEVNLNGAAPHDGPPLSVGNVQTAVLLPFPIRGEALLVKLAESLRRRIAGRAPWHNPFLLTMSRAPRSRLLIDHASYVEFNPRLAAYHVVVEAAPDTTVMLDTTDFDALVQFVARYVTDRLSDVGTAEAAS